MFRRGASASPAAVTTSSGDMMNAKPDFIKAYQKARNLPVLPLAMNGLKAPYGHISMILEGFTRADLRDYPLSNI
jgi:hypothetical protein